MGCDMCGKEGELFRAVIEGTEMNVCSRCAAFGKVLPRIRKVEVVLKKPIPKKETIERLSEDFSNIIRGGREKLGLTQEEFALKLNEKESIIHKIETGHIQPSIALARKIEKFLKISLVESEEIENSPVQKQKADGLTLGDFIKVKKG